MGCVGSFSIKDYIIQQHKQLCPTYQHGRDGLEDSFENSRGVTLYSPSKSIPQMSANNLTIKHYLVFSDKGSTNITFRTHCTDNTFLICSTTILIMSYFICGFDIRWKIIKSKLQHTKGRKISSPGVDDI